jgi:hypothetical protein
MVPSRGVNTAPCHFSPRRQLVRLHTIQPFSVSDGHAEAQVDSPMIPLEFPLPLVELCHLQQALVGWGSVLAQFFQMVNKTVITVSI